MVRKITFLVLAIFIVLPFSLRAAGTDDARHFADALGQQVLGVLNGNASEGEKQQKLQQIFSGSVDVVWMGRFVLGRNWQQASPEQQKRYEDAYGRFLIEHYTANFSDYSGSKYTITSVADNGEGRFTVNLKIKTPKQEQATEAGYLLQDAGGGQFKIHDIIIEGVSLLTTQRFEFASVVNHKGMDTLITDLENRATGERKS